MCVRLVHDVAVECDIRLIRSSGEHVSNDVIQTVWIEHTQFASSLLVPSSTKALYLEPGFYES